MFQIGLKKLLWLEKLKGTINYATKEDLKKKYNMWLIHQNLLKKVDLTNLKSDVDKLDTNKLKKVPSNLGNLKSKVDKLDVDKLVPALVGLSKLSDVVSNNVVKKDVYNAKTKNIKDKLSDITNYYLVLLT